MIHKKRINIYLKQVINNAGAMKTIHLLNILVGFISINGLNAAGSGSNPQDNPPRAVLDSSQDSDVLAPESPRNTGGASSNSPETQLHSPVPPNTPRITILNKDNFQQILESIFPKIRERIVSILPSPVLNSTDPTMALQEVTNKIEEILLKKGQYLLQFILDLDRSTLPQESSRLQYAHLLRAIFKDKPYPAHLQAIQDTIKRLFFFYNSSFRNLPGIKDNNLENLMGAWMVDPLMENLLNTINLVSSRQIYGVRDWVLTECEVYLTLPPAEPKIVFLSSNQLQWGIASDRFSATILDMLSDQINIISIETITKLMQNTPSNIRAQFK